MRPNPILSTAASTVCVLQRCFPGMQKTHNTMQWILVEGRPFFWCHGHFFLKKERRKEKLCEASHYKGAHGFLLGMEYSNWIWSPFAGITMHRTENQMRMPRPIIVAERAGVILWGSIPRFRLMIDQQTFCCLTSDLEVHFLISWHLPVQKKNSCDMSSLSVFVMFDWAVLPKSQNI